jgi:hypothetical protein
MSENGDDSGIDCSQLGPSDDPSEYANIAADLATAIDAGKCKFNMDTSVEARAKFDAKYKNVISGSVSGSAESKGSNSISRSGCESINAIAQKFSTIQNAVQCVVAKNYVKVNATAESSQTITIRIERSTFKDTTINNSATASVKMAVIAESNGDFALQLKAAIESNLDTIADQTNETEQEGPVGAPASTKNYSFLSSETISNMKNLLSLDSIIETVATVTGTQTIDIVITDSNFDNVTVNNALEFGAQIVTSAIMQQVVKAWGDSVADSDATAEFKQSNKNTQSGIMAAIIAVSAVVGLGLVIFLLWKLKII